MAKLTGAHLFIRCLKLEGIEKVFTIVGDTILPLVDAAEDEGIQLIDARHAGAALHIADGYARTTGRPDPWRRRPALSFHIGTPWAAPATNCEAGSPQPSATSPPVIIFGAYSEH